MISPHCKITFFFFYWNRKTFRKMSLNDFSYTLYIQLCSLATTRATPSLTLNILLGELFSNVAYLKILPSLWLWNRCVVFIGNRSVTVWSFVCSRELVHNYISTHKRTPQMELVRLCWLHRGPCRTNPELPALTLHSPGRVQAVSFPEILFCFS